MDYRRRTAELKVLGIILSGGNGGLFGSCWRSDDASAFAALPCDDEARDRGVWSESGASGVEGMAAGANWSVTLCDRGREETAAKWLGGVAVK